MSDLFQVFERRPPFCQACPVTHDNLDALANYYATSGYETDVARHGHEATLTLVKDGGDGQPVVVRPGQMLVYGHPPTVEDSGPFQADWRPEVKR